MHFLISDAMAQAPAAGAPAGGQAMSWIFLIGMIRQAWKSTPAHWCLVLSIRIVIWSFLI